MKRISLTIAGSALLAVLGSPVVAASQVPSTKAAGPYRYTVRSGDTLYDLAKNSLVRVTAYNTVRRLNRIANPLHLRIGSELLIPRELLRTTKLEGRVVAFRGAVLAQQQPVRVGSVVREGDSISTGAHAFLSVALSDGSTITLPSQSTMRIDRLRRIVISGEQDRVFMLNAGRSEMHVTPFKQPGDSFQIRTPVSVAAVRGTAFRVAVLDNGVASATSVMSGAVAVSAGSSAVLLKPNFGARANGSSIATVDLLPAPAFISAGKVQLSDALEFNLQPVVRALAYRVQIAKDAGFLDILQEEVSPTARVTLEAIPNGDYFARASVIDELGIEGQSHVTAFERYLHGIRTSIEKGPGRRQYTFRWRDIGDGQKTYRFALIPVAAPDRPVIDEAGLTRHELTLVDLPPGEYSWRVETTDVTGTRSYATWSDPNTLSIPVVTRRSMKRARSTAP